MENQLSTAIPGSPNVLPIQAGRQLESQHVNLPAFRNCRRGIWEADDTVVAIFQENTATMERTFQHAVPASKKEAFRSRIRREINIIDRSP